MSTIDFSLRELEARFLRHERRGDREYHVEVESIRDAQGVIFLCPLCYQANGGPVGTHSVICWNGTVPLDVAPGPGRWALEGSSIDDLTVGALPGKTRSVLLTSGCRWHGFITNGRAT